jgi:gas vesicle protein
MADQRTTFYCFVTGLGVGMAVTLLIAPRSGAATRKLIRRRAAEASDLVRTKTTHATKYIKRRSAATLEQAGKMIESCKEALDKRKTQLVGVVEAGKDAYQVATSKLASAL